MKNSIGKPYEGKLHVRFDEGGTDGNLNFVYLVKQIKRKREPSGSTLRIN